MKLPLKIGDTIHISDDDGCVSARVTIIENKETGQIMAEDGYERVWHAVHVFGEVGARLSKRMGLVNWHYSSEC